MVSGRRGGRGGGAGSQLYHDFQCHQLRSVKQQQQTDRNRARKKVSVLRKKDTDRNDVDERNNYCFSIS